MDQEQNPDGDPRQGNESDDNDVEMATDPATENVTEGSDEEITCAMGENMLPGQA